MGVYSFKLAQNIICCIIIWYIAIVYAKHIILFKYSLYAKF